MRVLGEDKHLSVQEMKLGSSPFTSLVGEHLYLST